MGIFNRALRTDRLSQRCTADSCRTRSCWHDASISPSARSSSPQTATPASSSSQRRVQWNLKSTQCFGPRIAGSAHTVTLDRRDLFVPAADQRPAPLQFPTSFLKGSPDFVPRAVLAYEVGYRAQIGRSSRPPSLRSTTTISTCASTTATPTTAVYIFPFPGLFSNNLEGDTHGL